MHAQREQSVELFKAWYERDMPRLFNYISYRLRDEALVEDLVAAICERAVKNLDRYDPHKGGMDAWMFGIARHELMRYLRDTRRKPMEVSLDNLPDLAAAGADVEETAEHAHLVRLAMRMLGKLDSRDQELIALRYGAGLSSDEIGRLLNLTPGNVRVRLHRTLEQLQQHVAALEGGIDG